MKYNLWLSVLWFLNREKAWEVQWFHVEDKGLLILDSKYHGPLSRYVKFRAAHGPGMPGTFSPPPRVSNPDMHHGTCVTHVPWYMPGSLISGFLWCRWRGKRSRHSRRMRNPQFYVSGKKTMAVDYLVSQERPVSPGIPLVVPKFSGFRFKMSITLGNWL